jgi:arylsulfatase A-like enzyme
MVFSGPGIRTGRTSSAPARLVDILPTIARLMKLNTPKMDGIVLGDALQNPLRKDVEDQVKSDVTLSPLRDALKKFG